MTASSRRKGTIRAVLIFGVPDHYGDYFVAALSLSS